MACCDDQLPVQWRYSVTGVLQQSFNAGGTWADAPAYDPRVYSPQFPPLPGDDGDDKKCAAATGAAALVKEQVGDQLTDDMSRYTLSQLINDWTQTMIGTSNPFEALVTVITNQIFALIIAVLRPALTDGVYDQFKCILFQDVGSDATVNDAQWAAVRSDILSQITGIAGVFLEHLVYLLGTGGLTNLIRSGAASSGDCSDCAPCTGFDTSFWTTGSSDPALGTIIDGTRTCNLVEIIGGLGGDGVYRAQLTGIGAADCVIGCHHSAISGAYDTTMTYVNLCGVWPVAYSVQNNNIHTVCFNSVIFQSHSAFTVRIDSSLGAPC